MRALARTGGTPALRAGAGRSPLVARSIRPPLFAPAGIIPVAHVASAVGHIRPLAPRGGGQTPGKREIARAVGRDDVFGQHDFAGRLGRSHAKGGRLGLDAGGIGKAALRHLEGAALGARGVDKAVVALRLDFDIDGGGSKRDAGEGTSASTTRAAATTRASATIAGESVSTWGLPPGTTEMRGRSG